MKAYKVFNEDWTCQGFKYEVGKSYHQDGDIEIGKNGFHACKKLPDCFNYYIFTSDSHVAIVELTGTIIASTVDSKICASDITIVKELAWCEVSDIINTSNNNTGMYNLGCCNSGYHNTGNCNTGSFNVGSSNTGNHNIGNINAGWGNVGDRNSGCYNYGNFNVGNRNSGSYNTGSWNSGNHNTGCFNTIATNEYCMFNKPCNIAMKDINFPSCLYFDLVKQVNKKEATKKEKIKHVKEIEMYGGFLKEYTYKRAFGMAWKEATDEEKEAVKKLPNFDADIFYKISGIRV